jgi:hypothetical protein
MRITDQISSSYGGLTSDTQTAIALRVRYKLYAAPALDVHVSCQSALIAHPPLHPHTHIHTRTHMHTHISAHIDTCAQTHTHSHAHSHVYIQNTGLVCDIYNDTAVVKCDGAGAEGVCVSVRNCAYTVV